ncbi:MAG: aldehyde-activating protein [Reinekea sp.]|nr:aldehyde-activating protein [Reinekea sp.]
MLTGHCHCGNITLTANTHPKTITECNCSICHRYGARWAYYTVADVTIDVRDTPTVTYRWGDKMIDFHHCPQCGCMTHYSGVEAQPKPDDRIAINTRMCAIDQMAGITIRHFDGADSFKYLD